MIWALEMVLILCRFRSEDEFQSDKYWFYILTPSRPAETFTHHCTRLTVAGTRGCWFAFVTPFEAYFFVAVFKFSIRNIIFTAQSAITQEKRDNELQTKNHLPLFTNDVQLGNGSAFLRERNPYTQTDGC